MSVDHLLLFLMMMQQEADSSIFAVYSNIRAGYRYHDKLLEVGFSPKN